ncbi:BAR/IMD domain-containing adapter protein 2 isoform X4 [Bemisia tabaci]|uniref:BAR/IMD domain-containing adapter protein 2 isoform X4 n=1 Tax=Bemisia tabaci TaxID=7038 RepID=UPI003B288D88
MACSEHDCLAEEQEPCSSPVPCWFGSGIENILEKFNPSARQMINAGKAYLKALHGAAAASRVYVEAITRLARQAQQGTWAGSADIGSALMQIVEVYKEVQSQQMNILKAFYVDLLVPLETNLEKDTKVVQSEQKRFLQQHKQRMESYSKAAAAMKKQRKKRVGSKSSVAMDKELKNMQILEEEKSKLDSFCEQSLKSAMTQERRRYGFVLERHCSLAKHYLAYHSSGQSMYQRGLDDWQDIAKTREFLPESVDSMFASKLRQISMWPDDDGMQRMEDDRVSVTSQLRKTKSMDASCLDIRAMHEVTSPTMTHNLLSRAKSDFNLSASNHSLNQVDQDHPTLPRPKSMAIPNDCCENGTVLARALYAYLSSGDNQLSFLEGDVIALMGERNKGWQFGENLRTQSSGWFPLAYTETLLDDNLVSGGSMSPVQHRRQDSTATSMQTSGNSAHTPSSRSHPAAPPPPLPPQPPAVTRFGDTLRYSAYQTRAGMKGNNVPPPLMPAPVVPYPPTVSSVPKERRAPAARIAPNKRPGANTPATGNVSLHSSNDSGFSNDPPPAPEVDYSDDEITRITPNMFATVKLRKTKTNDRSAPMIL